MLDKDPSTYTLITWAWVIVLSMWGGIVSFIKKVKAGEARPGNIVELIGELVTCSFVGVITFLAAQKAGFDQLTAAIFVAISAHMGTRALFHFEKLADKLMQRVLGRLFGVK